MHQNKTITSGFIKRVKFKKYKLPFFKNGSLNDVIEGFFFKSKRKNFPKSCSNEFDECLAYQ